MNISKAIRSVGTLTLINFARKHQEKLRASSSAEIAPLADRLQGVIEELDLAYQARRPLAALWSNAASVKDAALDASLGPVIAAESALRQAESMERDKRDALRRAVRKSAALLRAELMDEKLVDAYFPSVAESTVPEDEPAVTA
jgi:hypothetical protein